MEQEKRTLEYLESRLVPAADLFGEVEAKEQQEEQEEENRIEPIARENFEQLCKDFEENLYFTETMRDTLAIILSVVLSTDMDDDLLWLYVVGPPSSGKTTLTEALAGCPKCKLLDQMKSTNLVSGFKTDDGEDPSILKTLFGKTLVMGDFTEILSLSEGVQEQLYGILRRCYDGRYDRDYGNQESRHYSGFRFTVVAGVTDEIRKQNRSSLGERFLCCEVMDEGFDEQRAIEFLLSSRESREISSREKKEFIQACVYGFLENRIAKLNDPDFKIPSLPQWCKKRIIALSMFCAICRSTPSKNMRGELQYRPRPELGLRLAGQLSSLTKALAITLGKTRIDKECYRIVKKVALDTVDTRGFQFSTIYSLYLEEHTSLGIAERSNLSQSVIYRTLQNLEDMEIVTKNGKPSAAGVRGRHSHYYTLTDKIQEIVKTALGE